jgi:rod shape-determining protein MreC
VALLLACAVLLVLDLTGPALTPARRLASEVFGPLESAASTVARPVTGATGWFHSQEALRDRIGRLEDDNAALRQEVATSGFDRNRLAEYEGLTATAQQIGYAVVPARVVAYGASQSFSRTVTIDAGSAAGIEPDMTVLNASGLVGRVLRVSRSTATVLLVIDAGSVVGGRVGSSMEVGFLHGDDVLGHGGRLDLELLDQTVVPAKGDTVVTWGSSKGAPYVAGVPIGVVDSVYSSVRDSTQRARITPMVDFSSLDVVGVAVPSGTKSDRKVIDADGRLR